MENKFELYPYKHFDFGIYLCLIMSTICLLLIWLLEIDDASTIIILVIFSLFFLIWAKLESDLVPTVVILDDEGFEICGKAKNCYPKTKWEEIRFGRYAHDYQQSTYIMLSSRYLDDEEARSMATQQLYTRQLVIKGVPVILITESDTSKEFRKRVEEKIHIKPLEKYQ